LFKMAEVIMEEIPRILRKKRKDIQKVDEAVMRRGLEESLKYVLNMASRGLFLSSGSAEEIREIYSGVSMLAKEIGIDTSEYDLKFDERLKKYTKT